MKSIPSRTVWLLILSVALLAACRKPEAAAPPAPPVVLVTEATEETVPNFGEAIAKLDGSTVTPIHAQITGYLIKQAYTEGDEVKQGDLLFEIDPRPFQADLDKAQSNLAAAQDPLLKSKQDVDRSAALSNVDAARSAVTAAQVNLGLTKITAPVNGIAGKAISQSGDLINPSMTLTTISTVDPIQAGFNLTEQYYLNNADRLARIAAIPLEERPENMQLILGDGTPYPRKGRFSYLDRQAETSTGTMTAYALFPNPDKILRPGQYAKVRGMAEETSTAVLIPQRCVSEQQGVDQVVVIRPDNRADMRPVTTGERVGSWWIITNGLKAGEKVVVEGIEKCQPGELVAPQAYVAETPSMPTNLPPASPFNPE